MTWLIYIYIYLHHGDMCQFLCYEREKQTVSWHNLLVPHLGLCSPRVASPAPSVPGVLRVLDSSGSPKKCRTVLPGCYFDDVLFQLKNIRKASIADVFRHQRKLLYKLNFRSNLAIVIWWGLTQALWPLSRISWRLDPNCVLPMWSILTTSDYPLVN